MDDANLQNCQNIGVGSYFVRLESIDNLSRGMTVGSVGLSVLTPAAIVKDLKNSL